MAGKSCPLYYFTMNQDKPSYQLIYAALVLFALLLLASKANAQDTTRYRAPLELSYHMFTNVRQTDAGTSSNTDLFFGTKSGNVSIGVGYVRQIFSGFYRNTDFQAITPQAKIQFGFNNYFYFGPSTTIWRSDNYVEHNYGLEIGLFIQH